MTPELPTPYPIPPGCVSKDELQSRHQLPKTEPAIFNLLLETYRARKSREQDAVDDAISAARKYIDELKRGRRKPKTLLDDA